MWGFSLGLSEFKYEKKCIFRSYTVIFLKYPYKFLLKHFIKLKGKK